MHQKLSLLLLLAIAGTEGISNTVWLRDCGCVYLIPDILQVVLGLALPVVDLVLCFFFFTSMSVIVTAGSHHGILWACRNSATVTCPRAIDELMLTHNLK